MAAASAIPSQVSNFDHFSFLAHGSSVVTQLLLTNDRVITATDSSRDNIAVFSALTGELIHNLRGHQGGVWCLALFEDTLVSGSTDRTVRIWDLNTGNCTHVFAGHTGTVRTLVIAKPEVVETETESSVSNKEPRSDAPLIITGSRDFTLRVWALPRQGDPEHRSPNNLDSESGELQNDVDENPFHKLHLLGHDQAVRAVAAHGKTAVSGSYDFTVRVWDIVTGACNFVLRGHTDKVFCVTIDPMRPLVYSSSMDSTVRIWNVNTGDCARVLLGHTSLVGEISISLSHLVSAGADGKANVWNPDTGELLHTLSSDGLPAVVTCLQHSDTRAIGAFGGDLISWNITDGKAIKLLLKSVAGEWWQLAFDDKRCVAAANVDNATSIHIWDFDFGLETAATPRLRSNRSLAPGCKL